MHKKIFLCAVILIASGTLLFGQPGPPPPPAPQALNISPGAIPDGQYGAKYGQAIKAAGGKQPYTFSISAGNLPPGISFSSSGDLSGTPAAAGPYSFTITAQDHSKSPITGSQKYTLNIEQAALRITAGNATMSAGGTMPTFTVSYSGFVNGDNASSLTTPPDLSTTATASSPPGAYPIIASGAVDPNYSISYSPGTLTITAAAIAITAQPQTKAFGAPDPALTYTVSDLPNGANTSLLTGSLSRAPGENVGVYPISIGSLSAGPDYLINFTGNFLTITTASQQIAWTQDLLVGCNSTTQIQLNATASSGLPVTYSVSDATVAHVSGNVLTLVNPGTTVVTATQAGNGNYAPAPAVTDTLVYAPASLISQHWNDALFFDNSSGDYVQWQWYKDGQPVPGATDPYYSETPELNGQYYVIATNESGQQIQSCTLTVTGGAAIPGGIKAHPNPAAAGSLVTVTSNYPSSTLQGAILQVLDINGRVLQQLKNVQPSMQVTMPAETGIYIIDLLLAGGQKASINVLVDQ